MVSVNNLELFFADRPLFDQISFNIRPDDRIGLVGKNGAGKTTLLKAIAGVQPIDGGQVAIPKGSTIGYLPQDMDFVSGRTVWDETKSSFEKTLAIQKELEEINRQISERTDYESQSYLDLLDRLSELNEQLGHLGIDTLEARMEQILLGLGFGRNDFQRLTDEFSGGWRMRIELAKILLQQSDLLLLDEPTNHLDIESIQWLEEFLQTYPGAIVLISHDRTFLDNLTKRTIEISLGRIEDYNAPYTKYLQLRKERREHQLAAYENQQKQIKQTEAFIERFRAKATKAVQVQSRIKQLDRLDRIEVEEEDTQAMRLKFPPAPHSGKVVLEIGEVAKYYGEKLVFKDVNLMVERGDKISFVGKNGEGKSTLSRLITGEPASKGKIELGYQVKIGYYAQNQADILNPNKTVLETIDEAARGEVRTRIRTLLGSFLFQGDEVDKKVKVLSGGERGRLALCKLLLEPCNLLILDEPTNHLDIRSKDILKSALKDYDGTLILISHDRDFLKGLTDKTYEFDNKQVKQHLGGIELFLEKKMVENFREWEGEKKQSQGVNSAKASTTTAGDNHQLRKNLKSEIRSLSSSVKKSEKEISRLEEKLAEMNQTLKNPEAFAETNQKQLIEEWEKSNRLLEIEMSKWEVDAAALEAKEKELDNIS
jgi:ATP-binding cassette subfamily F protein 3